MPRPVNLGVELAPFGSNTFLTLLDRPFLAFPALSFFIDAIILVFLMGGVVLLLRLCRLRWFGSWRFPPCFQVRVEQLFA